MRLLQMQVENCLPKKKQSLERPPSPDMPIYHYNKYIFLTALKITRIIHIDEHLTDA